ncbi:hypothetical protein GCM10010343_13120 [Streptomyces avidinii]|nr:hypothetical protein GCM10010343_13120 [Streptomyces avidinii]
MAVDAAVVHGPVGPDLGDQGGVDEVGVQEAAAPPRCTRPPTDARARLVVRYFGDLPSLVRENGAVRPTARSWLP